MSSNPHQQAEAVAIAALERMGATKAWRAADARAVVKDLAEAGLLVAPQASSAERSEESLVSAVAESLRDFEFEVGPITFEMLKVGQAVYLTPEERHQIAHAAVRAYRQVVADE